MSDITLNMAASHEDMELDWYNSTTPTQGPPQEPQTTRHVTTIISMDNTPIAEDTSPSIPPPDKGWPAWRILLSFFVFEALLWGFPLSFGVFQNYYSTLPAFSGDSRITIVGTMASGIGYLTAPFVTPLIRRYSRYRRQMIWVGWPICILALVAGSFADRLSTLILTQGVMYSLGFVCFYYPILSMIDEWWVVRRGMAYGILCAASGFSGAVFPLAIEALLGRYGYRITLRAVAVALFVATGPLIPVLKGRLPETQAGSSIGRVDWTFLRKPLFWIYNLSNLVYGMGYFFPSLFLPSYATTVGLRGWQGALLLTVMSVSQVLGQFTFGYLSDGKVRLNYLIAIATVVSSLATFACWGIANSFGPLLVFAILFGFFGAGYTAMWARMASAVTDGQSSSLIAFSVFCFGKGIGNILAGPISGSLIMPAVHIQSYGVIRYSTLIIFTGVAMAISAICVGAWYGVKSTRSVAASVLRISSSFGG